MVNQVKRIVQQATNGTSEDPHTHGIELDSTHNNVEERRATPTSKHKSVTNEMDSPIVHLLPPEILSHIFTFYPIDFDHMTPLFLGSVCRRWREVAWSTPELWTYISVHLTNQIFGVIQRCSLWLDRSGVLPLNIRISSDISVPVNHSKTRAGINSLIATLQNHSRRWRHLDILTSIFLVMDHECPLESLRISRYSNNVTVTPYISMECLPNLRKIYLSSVSLNRLHIQWNNVTHIKLASPFHISDCWNIFQRCPKLVYCSFSSVTNGSGGAILGIIRLPSLKVLELGHSEWHSTDPLVLNSLELPALEELRYGCLSSPSETGSLLSLFKRSSCRLQSLIFESTRVSWDGFVPLLKYLPDLKKLSFKTELCYRGLFAELSRTPHNFLPTLEILDYTGPRIFTWATLALILGAACSSSTTLPCPRDMPIVCQHPPSVTSRPLKAIIFAIRSAGRKYPDAQSIPRFMNVLGKGVYLGLRHAVMDGKTAIASDDLLESVIKTHCRSELDRYIVLQTQTWKRCRGHFSSPDYWST